VTRHDARSHIRGETPMKKSKLVIKVSTKKSVRAAEPCMTMVM
jgi:hypothetical protein